MVVGVVGSDEEIRFQNYFLIAHFKISSFLKVLFGIVEGFFSRFHIIWDLISLDKVSNSILTICFTLFLVGQFLNTKFYPAISTSNLLENSTRRFFRNSSWFSTRPQFLSGQLGSTNCIFFWRCFQNLTNNVRIVAQLFVKIFHCFFSRNKREMVL